MASIIVLGGGVAGASVARMLRKGLNQRHEVTLVEQSPELYYYGSYPKMAVGRCRLKTITRATDRMRLAGGRVICGEAVDINLGKKTIKLKDGQTLFYDFFIAAPGVDASTPDTAELGQAGYNLYDAQGVLSLHNVLKNFHSSRVVMLTTSLPVRCVCALYEYAYMIDEWFRKKGNREFIDISVYTPEKMPLEDTNEKVSQVIGSRLKELGIRLFTGQQFINVDPEQREVHFASGKAPFDLLLYIPQNLPPRVIQNSALADETGRIPVDPFTLQTKWDGVYALGDINRIPLPGGGELPLTGSLAHLHALVAGHNIVEIMNNESPTRRFSGKTAIFLETGATGFGFIGNYYKQKVQFKVLPESRLWLGGKWMAEQLWLYEHS